MFDRVDDTIVAISSSPGLAVRGIIRMSGPESVRFAARLFAGEGGQSLMDFPGHRRLMGRVQIDTNASVPAEAYIFRSPASYTRQDIVEFHTAGSPPVLAMVFDQLVAAGARPAEPGEFTARAYFAGALDLTEVEGVAAMIHARNDSQLRASEALLHGQLSRRTIALREELAELLALLEAQIDFVEESIEFITGPQVVATLGRIGEELESLFRDAPSVERLETLPRVLLMGPPNAGKSTLFNRLTGVDRAIQSATAGTTRDVLSAPLSVPGGEVTLLDSAGLNLGENWGTATQREADKTPASPIMAPGTLAEAATRRSVVTADLILAVIDATQHPAETIRSLRSILPQRPALIVLNKTDAIVPDTSSLPELYTAVHVSALTGEGTSTLRERIGQMLFEQVVTHGSELLALSGRQRAALRDACDALRRGSEMCKNSREIGNSAELLALEVREAVNALSLLTGEIATEELLGRIFSRFCIGK